MLQVKTYIREVPGKGIGLFSQEFIPSGTIIHQEETFFDQTFPAIYLEEHPNLKKFFFKFATYDEITNTYYLCSDNARFWNHSSESNCTYDKNFGITTANRDINVGEELTLNDKKGLTFVSV